MFSVQKAISGELLKLNVENVISWRTENVIPEYLVGKFIGLNQKHFQTL